MHTCLAPRAVPPVWLVAVAVLCAAGEARAGELDKASQNAHTQASPSTSSTAGRSRGSGSRGGGGGGGSCDAKSPDYDPDQCRETLKLVLEIFGFPFFLPYVLFESDGPDAPAGWSWMPYPWAGGAPGYYEPVGGPNEDLDYAVPPEARRIVAYQLAVEGQPPLGGPGRGQLRFRLLTAYRMELDAAYGAFFDRNDSGGATAAATGNAHVTVRLAESEHVQFRTGAGLRHWGDAQGNVFGWDLLYGFDIFWGAHGPVTTSVELTGGSLGAGGVFEPRGTLGVMLGRAEIYAGYDAMWVFGGGPAAYVGGPIAGVRAYF